MVRATFGFGNGAPSDEKRLLNEEGYGIGITWLELDGSYMFSENIGLGAWGAWAFGGSEPDQDEGGPDLNTTSFFLGAEVPLAFGTSTVRVVISPRIGIGWGKVEFGSSGGKYDSGLAFGLEVSLLFPKAHVGPTVGIIRAPLGPPGELGRDYDAGATFIGVTGVIDG